MKNLYSNSKEPAPNITDFLRVITGDNSDDYLGLKPSTNYIIETNHIPDPLLENTKFVIILTNEDSVKYVVNDILRIRENISYIDNSRIKNIGDYSIIGYLYYMRQLLTNKYLDALEHGNGTLILNEFNRDLSDYYELIQIKSAAEQIYRLNPNRSAFFIFDEKYSSETEFFSMYSHEKYTIIKS